MAQDQRVTSLAWCARRAVLAGFLSTNGNTFRGLNAPPVRHVACSKRGKSARYVTPSCLCLDQTALRALVLSPPPRSRRRWSNWFRQYWSPTPLCADQCCTVQSLAVVRRDSNCRTSGAIAHRASAVLTSNHPSVQQCGGFRLVLPKTPTRCCQGLRVTHGAQSSPRAPPDVHVVLLLARK